MKNSILATCAASLMVGSANAAVTISYLGADTTNAASWRSTSVAKDSTFDVDGDNAYGTAGYARPSTSVAPGAALTTTNWVTGLPGFATLTASSGNIWHNAVYPDIDDPAQPIAPTVSDLTNPPSTYNSPTVTFTITSAKDFVFSVLSTHDSAGPGTLTITGPGGATAFVTDNSTTVGMYFFDMKGFQPNDTFTLSAAGFNGKFSAVAFDVIPEPSAALLGSLGMLALLRRRR
jgi:hypothetical protein